MLRLGCLETPVTQRSLGHIWRSDGANWFDPTAILPEYPEAHPAIPPAPTAPPHKTI